MISISISWGVHYYSSSLAGVTGIGVGESETPGIEVVGDASDPSEENMSSIASGDATDACGGIEGTDVTTLDAELASTLVTAAEVVTNAVETTSVIVLATSLPFSIASTAPRLAAGIPRELVGRKRVHQNMIRKPRSTIRCFRMKRTTRMKKSSAARMSSRSSQSDFSSAVMRCFEVTMRLSSTSCVEEADFSEAVDCSECGLE